MQWTILKQKNNPRLRWFSEARFGLFIHFGLYALLEDAANGEWVMRRRNIPREEYRKLMRRFNPHRFRADAWVATARAAGARYLTITAKHHDGFCLFDSALTDFKITNTPFGRDLIGELIAACHRRGLRIILYYSQPDWTHPCYVHRKGCGKDLQYSRPDDTPDWDRYLAYYHGQIQELCTKYGRIDGIWFDGVQKSGADWRGREVYQLIKRYQPTAVVNGRAGYGDFHTPERDLSGEAVEAGYLVESCESISAGIWSYAPDVPLHNSPLLLQSLVRMSANGANYLLNIGPQADGSLPPEWVARLRDIGRWLATHGAAIYGTEGCPGMAEAEDRYYTRQGHRLYLHLLQWPSTNFITLNRLKMKPRATQLLATHARLQVRAGDGAIQLGPLPSMPPHPVINVIEMEFATPSCFQQRPKRPGALVHVFRGERLVLPIGDAVSSGFGLKGGTLPTRPFPPKSFHYTFGWLPTQTARWKVRCERPQCARMLLQVACPNQNAGSPFVVKTGSQILRGKVPATTKNGHPLIFKEIDLGALRLKQGLNTIAMRPLRNKVWGCFGVVPEMILKYDGRRQCGD